MARVDWRAILRLRAKATVLVLSTVSAVGLFSAPASASEHRGKVGCVNWMYTTQTWGDDHFYYHSHCRKSVHLRITYKRYMKPMFVYRNKCLNVSAARKGRTDVPNVQRVSLVKHC
jgi:hypothetical protein